MKDLKVLWLGKNDETRLFQESFWLRQELKKLCHLTEHGIEFKNALGNNVKFYSRDLELLTKTFKPDIILIYSRKKEEWLNKDKINVPVAIIMTDPHGFVEERLKYINDNKIEMTLFRSWGHEKGYGMDWWSKHLFEEHKQRWLPQSCNTEVFKDYGLDRIYDFTLLGRAHASTYPLRHLIYKWLGYGVYGAIPHTSYKVFHRVRPKRTYGWTEKRKKANDVISGKDYAKVLAQTKIVPTGCSVYGYAVAKCFETAGSGAALACDKAGGFDRLGFIPDINFIHIDQNNFKDKIEYYINNMDETRNIANNAMKLMHARHSTKIRAKELLNYLEELV